MALHYLALFLETVFFVGLAGSLVVAIWAFIGDCFEFFEDDKREGPFSQASGDLTEHVPSHY